jgi:hypothetical protein
MASEKKAKNAAQRYTCANCTWVGSEAQTVDAPDALLRHSIGDIFSDRECPECGALCYPLKSAKKKARAKPLHESCPDDGKCQPCPNHDGDDPDGQCCLTHCGMCIAGDCG